MFPPRYYNIFYMNCHCITHKVPELFIYFCTFSCRKNTISTVPVPVLICLIFFTNKTVFLCFIFVFYFNDNRLHFELLAYRCCRVCRMFMLQFPLYLAAKQAGSRLEDLSQVEATSLAVYLDVTGKQAVSRSRSACGCS